MSDSNGKNIKNDDTDIIKKPKIEIEFIVDDSSDTKHFVELMIDINNRIFK